jgi:hypothetical protein
MRGAIGLRDDRDDAVAAKERVERRKREGGRAVKRMRMDRARRRSAC